MAGPTAVSPTELNPEWDVTLTDGTDSVGFVLVDGQGNPNPRAIQRTPFGPRTALKTAQGASKYEDYELPYMSISQDDWSGGVGNKILDEDASRSYDSYMANTLRAGQITLGGLQQFWSGYRTEVNTLNDGTSYHRWAQLGTTIYASSFSHASGFTASATLIWAKHGEASGDITVKLCPDSGGVPDYASPITTSTNGTSTVSTSNRSYLISFGTATALSAGTTYWIVVEGDATWSISVGPGSTAKTSTNGTVWVSGSADSDVYYRIKDANVAYNGKFFYYKGAQYAVVDDYKSGNYYVLLNGDRGVADSNTGALGTLVDATKSWTTDQWVGSHVKLTAGPGSDEETPYRRITANTSNTLSVTPNWTITHTTNTEYVIEKTNAWQSWHTLSRKPVDVAVAGENVFFATGSNGNAPMMREYNNAGTWTKSVTTSNMPLTSRIAAIQQADGSYNIYGACIEYDDTYKPFEKGIWAGKSLFGKSSLYKDYGEVLPTNVPWSHRKITNVTHDVNGGMTYFSLASGFTTGVFGVYEPDEPVDLSQGQSLGFWIKTNETTASGDIQLKLDDVTDLGGNKQPLKVLGTKEYNPISMIHYDGTLDAQGNPKSGDYYNLNTARDGSSAANIIASWTSAMTVYVGYSTPFHSMYIDMGSTVNAVSADLTVKYYDGNSWNSITVSDGTENGTATLGQDGTVQFGTAWRSDWQPFIINSVEAYWVALSVDATLTANITIADVKVMPYPADIIIPAGDGYMDGTIDSQTEVSMQALTGILVGSDAPFNGVIWDLGSTVNAVAGTMAAYYFNGTSWTSLSLTDGTLTGGTTTLGQDGSMTFTIPYNWQPNTMGGTEAYWLWLKPSANLTRNILVYSISVTRQNNVTINLPAITAFEWQYVVLTPSSEGFNKYPYPDCTQIRSIALNMAVSQGTGLTIRLDGGIHLLSSNAAAFDWIEMQGDVTVNNIIPYTNPNSGVVNPWVLTDRGVMEIQTENNNALADLPIGEISTISGHNTGYAACTNDVYLYFNINEKIQRYYNGTLENIGPEQDDGLSWLTNGEVVSLVSYPGIVLAGYNNNNTSNDVDASAIYGYSGNGFHNIWRHPHPTSVRIKDFAVQPIVGSTTQRVWILDGTDIFWVPLSITPELSSDYYYHIEGSVVTGWIFAGMQTVKKVFDSVEALVDNTQTTGDSFPRYVTLEYQTAETDGIDSGWTAVSGYYDTELEKIALASTRPTGRKIRFRISLYSRNPEETPIMRAFVLDLYGIVPVKYQYTFTGRLAELSNATQPVVNLDGQDERALGYADAAETSLAKLDSWTDNATVLTMNSRYSVYDSKTVLADSPGARTRVNQLWSARGAPHTEHHGA